MHHVRESANERAKGWFPMSLKCVKIIIGYFKLKKKTKHNEDSSYDVFVLFSFVSLSHNLNYVTR